MEKTSNYTIKIFDCVSRKKVYSVNLENATKEKATEEMEKLRFYFTWKSNHFCDGTIIDLTEKEKRQ